MKRCRNVRRAEARRQRRSAGPTEQQRRSQITGDKIAGATVSSRLAKILRCSGTVAIAFLAAGIAWAQGTDLVAVVSKPVSRIVELPGEFQAFQSVAIHAKVRGY